MYRSVLIVLVIVIFVIGITTVIDEEERQSPAQEQHTTVAELPTYSTRSPYASYSVGPNGTKTFRLTASQFRWRITNKTAIEVYGFNQQVPGPAIRATKGERIRVRVKNDLTEPKENLSVHWHGLPTPARMNGVAGVNQEPIRPGETFTYTFQLNTTGTFIYHAAATPTESVDMGLSGPLIVDNQNSTALSYDVDKILFLDDWVIGANGSNLAQTQPPQQRTYNYFTINGKAFPATDPIRVFQGDRVRLRLINTANSYIPFHMHVQGQSPTVVARDGTHIPSYQDDTISLAPGQRYDIVFNATTAGNWPLYSRKLAHQTNNGSYPGGMISFIEYQDDARPSPAYGG